MSEWVFAAVPAVGAAAIAAFAALTASKRQARADKQADTHKLVDQLQEELAAHRERQALRSLEQDKRMNALEERNGILVERADKYRDALHEHRAHIYDDLGPPPPPWPEGQPR